MESTWTKADFRNYGKLQGASGDLLRSTQEVLARELGLSLSAFLRCSVTSVFTGAEERPFGDLQKNETQTCLGTVLVRPDDRSILVEMGHSVLYPLIGIALGAKMGSFVSPDRKPTDIELQVVNILFRLILSEAYRGWMPLTKAHLETVTLEIGRSPSRAFQATDSMLVAGFDLTVGEHTGRLSMIVPPQLFQSASETDEPVRREKTEISGSAEVILQLMLPAKVAVDVWLDGSQMLLRDLLQLREGQIVKLDHPVERRAVCTLNGKSGFSGQIVSTGARRAFMVEEASGTQS
ncbi:MAG TPA: flagellar motor switch protein FliM [Bryobacteraceae bacterium]|jgi:flagellar motor switch protein FliM|nr:flagellar motor switch protein FliM [Bryobacteraceae bacterium]